MELWFVALPGVLSFVLLTMMFVWMMRRGGGELVPRDAPVGRGTAPRAFNDAGREDASILPGTEEARERIAARFERAVSEFLDAETRRLAEAAERLSVEYQNLAEEARGVYARVTEEVSKEAVRAARAGIQEFESFIRIEMARYERITDQNLEEWRRAMQTEIQKKKEEALKRVEESIYRILFFVSKDVLGRTIDLETHQSLIVRALDDAKRQGFFDS